ncbi:hypothetical protein BT96DRAFT_980359 [Gymnopus androsaceus JB14]|uniref:Uncharacterized protein n=1 Tax=Gymnopus androsaceus JB14 TaxID=1447944 RepID=A0A6A4GWQ0_9AGAR|nr:hypothetical protein BT96DRAFT_980359 [Gymnopus androsaceus JB14]
MTNMFLNLPEMVSEELPFLQTSDSGYNAAFSATDPGINSDLFTVRTNQQEDFDLDTIFAELTANLSAFDMSMGEEQSTILGNSIPQSNVNGIDAGQKVRRWPGSYYTFEIVDGFKIMDIIRGGNGKRPQGQGKLVQFEAAFPGVGYKSYKKCEDSPLLCHYIGMGAKSQATWMKFEHTKKNHGSIF